MSESRRRMRVPGQFEAVIRCGEKATDVLTENLSLKGAFCRTGDCAGMTPGVRCVLRIELAEKIAVEVEARVVRCGDETAALEFTDMDPASFAHLRNIVRFSSQDPDAIDAEVGAERD